MKVLFFTKQHCPYCDKIKQQFKDVPSSKDFINIDQSNMTEIHRAKYGVRGFPTLIFLSDDGKFLGRLVGYQEARYINNDINTFQTLEKTLK